MAAGNLLAADDVPAAMLAAFATTPRRTSATG